MIYFDSAATTLQKPGAVPAAVADAIHTMTTPGRGDHPAARLAAELMLRCRTEAAELFDVSQPDNVILTSNATHALNIAIKSLVSPGDTVVISGYEHNAVTRPLHAIGSVSVRIVNGRLFDPAQMAEGFRRAVDRGVSAVVCTHMSNVFGYVLPIDDIAAVCREKGVPLIVDASQSAGILPVSLGRWGAAYVAMPGHKGLYGPQGTGLLLCGLVVIQQALPYPWGSIVVLLLFLSVWANDSFAYLVGSKFGKHKLAPRTSPKKSWEGFLAGIVGSAAFWVAIAFVPGVQLPVWLAVLFGVVCALAEVLGDLVESRIKRNSGFKDSGTIMPGHGGLLDRCDSLFLASAVAAILLVGFGCIPSVL